MSNPDERLDAALKKKIREHEETTAVGVICPDCKQEVAHECALPPQSLITPYGHQPPLQFHRHDNDNPRMGKRKLYPTNPECGPERKRVRNLSEERIQQGEFYPSRPLTSPGLCLPSFVDSIPPSSTTPPAPETIFSPSVPGILATSSDVITEPESDADWSITYNIELKREIEVSVVRPLDMGSWISCLTFSKDGKYLAVGFENNGTTNIYDVQTGDKTCTLREYTYAENRNEEYIDALCFSSDGMHLATGGSEGLIRIWEISKKHVRNVLRTSMGRVYCCIQLSPNSRLIALGYSTGILEICNWRDSSRKSFEVSEQARGTNAVRFSPDGKYIAVAQRGPEVLICNARTGQLIKKLGDRALLSVAFMPDGTGLIGGCWDSTVCWDISSLSFGSQRMKAMETGTTKELLILSDLGAAGFVAVSSNGRWIVSCSNLGVIRISNTHSAELHCELRQQHYVEMGDFDFSPITGLLAACWFGGSRVFLWRFEGVLD